MGKSKYRHTGTFHTFKKVPEKKENNGWAWFWGIFFLFVMIAAFGS